MFEGFRLDHSPHAHHRASPDELTALPAFFTAR